MDHLTEQLPWIILIGGLLAYDTFNRELTAGRTEPTADLRRRRRERLRFYHPSTDTELELLINDELGFKPSILKPVGWTLPFLTGPSKPQLTTGRYSLDRPLTPDEIDRLLIRLSTVRSGTIEVSVLDSQLPRLIRHRCRERAEELRFVYDTVLIE